MSDNPWAPNPNAKCQVCMGTGVITTGAELDVCWCQRKNTQTPTAAKDSRLSAILARQERQRDWTEEAMSDKLKPCPDNAYVISVLETLRDNPSAFSTYALSAIARRILEAWNTRVTGWRPIDEAPATPSQPAQMAEADAAVAAMPEWKRDEIMRGVGAQPAPQVQSIEAALRERFALTSDDIQKLWENCHWEGYVTCAHFLWLIQELDRRLSGMGGK